MKNDLFGDRMKLFEQAEAGRKAMPLIPLCVRLDGRGFSKFTKGLQRPFDTGMSKAMVLTTMFLVEKTHPKIGYTQSDEISLVYYTDDIQSEIFFNGKIQKIVSVLAGLATAKFNALLPEHLPSKIGLLPVFDCRAWNVPNLTEAANVFLWREKDATKNSISMAAQHYYSHKELENRSAAEQHELLWNKGINWDDYPSFFKRGTFVQRKKTRESLTEEELKKIPVAHRPPNNLVERSSVVELEMPPFNKVINRVEVIFQGAQPQTEEPAKTEKHHV